MRIMRRAAYLEHIKRLAPSDRQWIEALEWHVTRSPFDHPIYNQTREGVRRAAWGSHFIVFYTTYGHNDDKGLIIFLDFKRRVPRAQSDEEEVE